MKPVTITANRESTIQITCPSCGPPGRLVVRLNRTTWQEFLGCTRYPRCTYSQPLTAYLEATRAGHPTLPGFDA